MKVLVSSIIYRSRLNVKIAGRGSIGDGVKTDAAAAIAILWGAAAICTLSYWTRYTMVQPHTYWTRSHQTLTEPATRQLHAGAAALLSLNLQPHTLTW